MHFDIFALTPNLTETFTQFLKNLDFSHEPHWASCFCRYYHSTCSTSEWFNRTKTTNELEARQAIEKDQLIKVNKFV